MNCFSACVMQARVDSNSHGEMQKSSRQQCMSGKREHQEKVNETMEVSILNQKRKRNNENDNQNDETNEEETQAHHFAQDVSFQCFKCGHKECKGGGECPCEDAPKSPWVCTKAIKR